MILNKCPRRLASARAGCLLDGGGFDGYDYIGFKFKQLACAFASFLNALDG